MTLVSLKCLPRWFVLSLLRSGPGPHLLCRSFLSGPRGLSGARVPCSAPLPSLLQDVQRLPESPPVGLSLPVGDASLALGAQPVGDGLSVGLGQGLDVRVSHCDPVPRSQDLQLQVCWSSGRAFLGGPGARQHPGRPQLAFPEAEDVLGSYGGCWWCDGLLLFARGSWAGARPLCTPFFRADPRVWPVRPSLIHLHLLGLQGTRVRLAIL